MRQDDDMLVDHVTRDEARTLKRSQVPITKMCTDSYPGPGPRLLVGFLAPRWAANALRQCKRGSDRRALMTLLRRAQHDADVRDALRAAVLGRCVPELVRTQTQKATP